MSPPVSVKKEEFVSSGAPLAPNPGGFPPNVYSGYMIQQGSHQAPGGVPPTNPPASAMQAAQQANAVQAPQQANAVQAAQQAQFQQNFNAAMNGMQMNPMQFFIAAQATMPASFPAAQMQAPIPQQQQAPYAFYSPPNTSPPPGLISDPNWFVSTGQPNYSFQLQPMPQPSGEVQKQQQPQQQQLQPQQQQWQQQQVQQQHSQQLSGQFDPNVQMQACASVIQQALQNPEFAAAGQVLLQSMQSSSTYINDLMKNQTTVFAQQADDAPADKKISPTGSQEMLFLGSSLEPVKRSESGDEGNNQSEDDMWKMLFKCEDDDNDDDDLDTSFDPYPVSSTAETPVQQQQQQPCNTAIPPPSPVKSQYAPASAQPFPPPAYSLVSSAIPPPPPKPTSTPVKSAPVRADCGKVKKTRPPIEFAFQGTPQQYLMAILKERGYSSELIPCDQSGYQSKPTPLELASFGTEVVKAVNAGNVPKLASLLDCGLSPSPCNSFGDFIVHLVCKRADIGILQCLVDHGCNLEVCDSFGRTPLHHVAWAGDFCKRSAELILNTNASQILVQDKRGQCPLEYVRKQDWPKWIEFLRTKMDTYWPINRADQPKRLSPKQERPPTMSLDLAAAVASGAISAEDAAGMDEVSRSQWEQETLKDLLTFY